MITYLKSEMSELQTIEKSFEEALKRLEASPTRRFKQTYEIIINLEGIDVKRDAEKLSGILKLPHPIQGLNNKLKKQVQI